MDFGSFSDWIREKEQRLDLDDPGQGESKQQLHAELDKIREKQDNCDEEITFEEGEGSMSLLIKQEVIDLGETYSEYPSEGQKIPDEILKLVRQLQKYTYLKGCTS